MREQGVLNNTVSPSACNRPVTWFALCCLGTLATAVAGQGDAHGSLPRVRRLMAAGAPVRVVVYGDSISELKEGWSGGATSSEANWGNLLARRLSEQIVCSKFSVSHFATGGQNSYEGLGRLDWLSPHAPDLVLVAFGANDCCHHFLEPAETKLALVTLCREIRERYNADVVVVGTAGDNPKAAFFRHLEATLDAQRQAAADTGAPFVDVRAAMLAATDYGTRWAEFHLAQDNCHPNDKGHAVWAESTFRVLRQVLEESR